MNTPVLWYFSRASGLVALALFTAVVVLGALSAARTAGPGGRRLSLALVHRGLALTSLVFLALHIATAVLDSYVPLGWADVLLPFGAAYRPFWVGLGAVAVDLLLAVTVTSLLRTRLPAGLWRGVHWLSYLCWPVALVHGIGMAHSDAARGWIAGFDGLCVLAVLVAVAVRARAIDQDTATRRTSPLQPVPPGGRP